MRWVEAALHVSAGCRRLQGQVGEQVSGPPGCARRRAVAELDANKAEERVVKRVVKRRVHGQADGITPSPYDDSRREGDFVVLYENLKSC